MNQPTYQSWKLSGSRFEWRYRSFRYFKKAESNNERVGVVVVTHTFEFLEDCLGSIENQRRKADRVIVVNNGSPESNLIRASAESYDFEFVDIISPTSPANARNTACQLLDDCFYIANLDGDDVWNTEYLQKYLEVARTARADVVYGPALLFGNEDGVTFTWRKTGVRDNLRVKNYVPANSVFKRSVWRSVGGYDSAVGLYGDYEFWMNAARAGARFAYVDLVLWKYRRHEASQVRQTPEQDRQQSHVLIRRKHIRYINGVFQWRRVIRGLSRIRNPLSRAK